jgi:uncharacterized membrane protein
MNGYAQHPYWQHAGHGHPFLWLLFLVIFAFLVGAVAIIAARRLAGRPQGFARFAPAGPAEDALSIVRMRYARGEIDRDQFLQATADLGGTANAPVAEPPPDAPTGS